MEVYRGTNPDVSRKVRQTVLTDTQADDRQTDTQTDRHMINRQTVDQ